MENMKVDRRIRKTRAMLRDGLASLLEEKSIRDIRVKELVEIVDINRSTFYLHYTDIYDLLEKIEQELMEKIQKAFTKHPLGQKENTLLFIADIFEILSENRTICKALVGPHGDMAFVIKIENVIGTQAIAGIMPHLKETSQRELRYIYAYCLQGCVGLVKDWLLSDASETPQEMSNIMFKMVENSLSSLYENRERLG